MYCIIRSKNVGFMLLGLPMVGGPFLHQTRNNMNKCIAFVDDDSKICRHGATNNTVRNNTDRSREEAVCLLETAVLLSFYAITNFLKILCNLWRSRS